jgi:hypothetical protein
MEVTIMMRLAAASVMLLCSIATADAQEPSVAPSAHLEQRTCVFSGENYSEGAEICIFGSHVGLSCADGKWSRDSQLECGGFRERMEQYHGGDDHMMPDHTEHMDHMDHMPPQ